MNQPRSPLARNPRHASYFCLNLCSVKVSPSREDTRISLRIFLNLSILPHNAKYLGISIEGVDRVGAATKTPGIEFAPPSSEDAMRLVEEAAAICDAFNAGGDSAAGPARRCCCPELSIAWSVLPWGSISPCLKAYSELVNLFSLTLKIAIEWRSAFAFPF